MTRPGKTGEGGGVATRLAVHEAVSRYPGLFWLDGRKGTCHQMRREPSTHCPHRM